MVKPSDLQLLENQPYLPSYIRKSKNFPYYQEQKSNVRTYANNDVLRAKSGQTSQRMATEFERILISSVFLNVAVKTREGGK